MPGSGVRSAVNTPASFLPRMGPSGTSARHATASDPARMPFARSSPGGAFEVIPAVPPCVCTSTEMDFRRTSSAAEAVAPVSAAAVEPPGPPPPPSIAPKEVSIVPHIQLRRVSARPQQSMSSPSGRAASLPRHLPRSLYSVHHLFAPALGHPEPERRSPQSTPSGHSSALPRAKYRLLLSLTPLWKSPCSGHLFTLAERQDRPSLQCRLASRPRRYLRGRPQHATKEPADRACRKHREPRTYPNGNRGSAVSGP